MIHHLHIYQPLYTSKPISNEYGVNSHRIQIYVVVQTVCPLVVVSCLEPGVSKGKETGLQ